MPGVSKEIQRRIKSIKATRKITKAMELVSAVKMRKSQMAVMASRPYARTVWEVVMNLIPNVDTSMHPLFGHTENLNHESSHHPAGGTGQTRITNHPLRRSKSEASEFKKKIFMILIASDKGLCGSMNAQICGKALSYMEMLRSASPWMQQGEQVQRFVDFDFVTIGKKAREWARRVKVSVIADFTNMGSVVRASEVRPITKLIVDDFVGGAYTAVYLAYTDFVSTLKQVPRVKKLLPLDAEMDTELGEVRIHSLNFSATPPKKGTILTHPLRRGGEVGTYEYLFEPSPELVLNSLLPKLVALQVYQAILESNASEHSARMVAMKNATDAAADMLVDLSLAYNQARQASITQEIAEIATAAVAMGGNQ